VELGWPSPFSKDHLTLDKILQLFSGAPVLNALSIHIHLCTLTYLDSSLDCLLRLLFISGWYCYLIVLNIVSSWILCAIYLLSSSDTRWISVDHTSTIDVLLLRWLIVWLVPHRGWSVHIESHVQFYHQSHLIQSLILLPIPICPFICDCPYCMMS